jgi:hypothetical protein
MPLLDRLRPRSRPPGRRDLVADEQGAIMVIGIFMCVFLVGALWYIAGIGDALVFHERMQEAADSVAFSAAIIEARGMNIIVLMNLLMAAILAIRVAINLIKVVCIAGAAIFAGICLIPFMEWACPVAELCADGAEYMQEADDDTRSAIDDALEGLHTAETGVAYATPAAAWAGAFEMAQKYTPPVSFVVLDGKSTAQGWGLPIQDGTLGKLCHQAASGVASLLTYPLSAIGLPSQAVSVLNGLITGITANDFFCELGSGDATPPDFSQQINDANSQGCQGKQQKLCDDASAAQSNYQSLQSQDGYVNGQPGPNTTAQQQQDVQAAYSDWQNKQSSCDNFDMGQCQSDLKQQQQQAEQKAQNAANSASNGSTSSGGNKTPAMVKSDWYNGTPDAQIVSFVNSNDSNAAPTKYSPQLVNIASMGKHAEIGGPNAGQMIHYAQSEFFYDCSGAWTDSACNGGTGDDGQNAMWNFHWRARFRLFDPSAVLGGQAVEIAEGAMRFKIGSDIYKAGLGSLSFNTYQAKLDLGQAILGSAPLTLH